MAKDDDEAQDDRALWIAYKKTITPLKKSKRQAGLSLQKKIELDLPKSVCHPPFFDQFDTYQPPIGTLNSSHASLAYQNKKKIRKNITLEGRLDLHGMTQEEALQSLGSFIHRCFLAQKQDLLVITGKGIKIKEGHSKGGVLRRHLPLWLEEGTLRPYVHFYTNHHPFEGGTGAFYVRLRKNKKIPL